jgi:hypothetical protein
VYTLSTPCKTHPPTPQVKSYARQHQFSVPEHERVTKRLSRLDKLFRSASAGGSLGSRSRGATVVRSSEALLELAAGASAQLEAFYEMEGESS